MLEARIAPAVASVASIVRAGGAAADTSAVSVAYTVTFSEAVTGVDATDFLVHTEQSAHAHAAVTVAAVSSTVYTVTVHGLHGQGDVRLDLIDNDSITGASGKLGGPGVNNGSYQGAADHLLQTFPKITSITANGGTSTNASTVSWSVTLSSAVTGVDPTDFTLVKSGVSANAAVTVTPVSSILYTVTATGVSGPGTLALKLVDDGTIKDATGNPLQGTPPPAFAAQASPATGTGPYSVAVADVNGDGRPDLVIANHDSNTVSVLLGNGTGGFAAKRDFATGTGPLFVAVADVNGDGRPDLVTANANSNTVSVLLGDGSGGFAGKTDFATGTDPSSVAVVDVNGDGKPDLVSANTHSNTVSVLRGNGSGGFAAKTDFATGTGPSSVAVADVNGDRKPDLVIANRGSNTVSLLLGNGTGGFAAKTDFGTGSFPNSVAVADVNGDGLPDLLTANTNSNTVSVLRGNGSGGFAGNIDFTTGRHPSSVAVADVDGDGHRDLVTADFDGNTVSVLRGNGSGGFAAQTSFATGNNPFTVAVADVNGNGQPDLVIANSGSDTVSVLLGAGVGTFTGDSFTVAPPASAPLVSSITHVGPANLTGASEAWTVTFNSSVTGVDASDFAALASGAAKTGAISVAGSGSVYTVTIAGLHGSGDVQLNLLDNDSISNSSAALGGAGVSNGSFQGDAIHLLQTYPQVSSITANGSTTTHASSVSWTVTLSAPVTGVDATDFTLVKTGVSANAAVTVTPVSSTVYTVTATGLSGAGTLALKLVDDGTIKDAYGNPLRGTLAPVFAAQASPATGSHPISVAVADVNGDGHPDLLIANIGSGMSVLLGNGNGGFAAKTDFATKLGGPFSAAVADVNRDGHPDLVIANGNDYSVSVLLGDGSGGFAARTDFATGSFPFSVAVADVNRDGQPDLVIANFDSNTVSVLLGNGSGGFAVKTDFATGSRPIFVTAADVNGDGQPDLVTANASSNTVSVLLGTGSGRFSAQTTFATGTHPHSVAVADVNRDGQPDLVIANIGSNTVSVLLGTGSGGFAARTDFATGSFPNSVAVADVNGDGQPDLVIANYGSSTVSVLLGNGSGGFAVKTDFATGSSPIFVAAADVNGDGKPDLVTANFGGATASVLLGAGVGTFTGDTFTVPPPVPVVSSIVHVGSPNLTGASEAWTVTFNTSVTGVHASDFAALASGGARTGAISVAGSGSVYTVTIAGLHGSGDVQLSLIDHDSISNSTAPLGGPGLSNGSFQGDAVHLLQTFPKVSSITADGSTTTSASSVSWTVTLSAPVTGVDPTDFTLVKGGVSTNPAVKVTGSGTTYIVTATGVSGAGTLALELVDDGTIRDANGNPLQGTPPPAFAAQASPATGTLPISVAVADVNGDGQPDLVTANQGGGTVSVLLGNGSGGFAAKTDFATGIGPVSVAVADVNGDGRPDLLIANFNSNTVSVLLGNGSGGFAAKTDFATGKFPYAVAVADVNGDGKPDLVTANGGSGNVSVLLGTGTGGFAAKTNFATGIDPRSVAVADVNGDGQPDLVVANANSNTVSVLLGNGSGAFAAKTDFATGDSPFSVAVADVNGDRQPDLVIANYGSGTVSVLLGTGSGAFAAKTDFATGRYPRSGAVADVNGDGQPDLVIANLDSFTVSVLLGTGSGSFAKTDFATGSYPHSVAVADVNGDGKPDFVTANLNSSTVSVLLGAGVGTFTGDTFIRHQHIYAVSTGITNPKTGPIGTVNVFDASSSKELFSLQPYGKTYHDSIRIAIADFNGDGYDDLVTSTRTGTGQIRVFSGLTGLPLAGFSTINPFNGHSQQGAYIAAGDVTGDGLPDIVVGSAIGGGTVKIYNGATEAFVTSYTPFGAHFTGGIRVAVTPAHGETPGNVVAVTGYGAGLVKEFQGTSGTHPLLSFSAGGKGYQGGLSVAVGDVNSDGTADLIVGSNVGHAFVDIFNGTTGTLIRAPIEPFGPKGVPSGARVAATDVNGDGIADIIVAAGADNSSQVQIYDGATDQLISTFKAFPARPDIAIFVAASTESAAPVTRRFT